MKIKYGKHNGGIRFTALVVAFVFTATSVTWTTSANAAPAEVTAPIYSSIDTLAIPTEMGSISKNFLKDGGESALPPSTIHLPQPGKTVILIQDAHAVIDAQENIAKILGHLRKSYGVNLTALEGAKGPLEPILLRTFPVASVKNRVMSGYEKRAELSGPEMAAVFGNGPEKFQGMEEWGLYEQNYSAYLRAQEKKSSLVTRWNSFKQKLDSERTKVYSPQLNEFQIARENFLNERASLMDLLVYFSGFSSLLKASSGYQELPGLIASIGYEKSGKQDALVPLVRQIADEFKVKYLRGLGVKTEMNFYNRYQAFLTGQITAGQMLQYLVQLGREQGKGVKLTPALKKLLGHAELLSEIKGSRLYDELQRFLPELESSLIKTPAEREIAGKYQKLFLLKEMIELELTHEGLATYQKEPDAYLGLMADPTFKQDLVPALEFYQAALARDQAFMGKIDAMMKSENQKTVAVVAGGFHTNGLERILKEQGVAYAVVTPKIASLEGIENYAKVMKGDVSFKEYLKTTYFDGLMRHASKTLADALPITDRVQTLKLWRDDVIRDLAKQGRIAEAGKYLPYIDEQLKGSGEVASVGPKRTKEEILDIVKKELERFKKDSLERIWKTFEFQLGIFTDGLKQLVSKKELNTQTVSDLLFRASRAKPIAMQAVFTNGLFPDIEVMNLSLLAAGKMSDTGMSSVGEIAKTASKVFATKGDVLDVLSNMVGKTPEQLRNNPVGMAAQLLDVATKRSEARIATGEILPADKTATTQTVGDVVKATAKAASLSNEQAAAGILQELATSTSATSEIPGASVKRSESRERSSVWKDNEGWKFAALHRELSQMDLQPDDPANGYLESIRKKNFYGPFSTDDILDKAFWAAFESLPEVPEGYVRLFHQTGYSLGNGAGWSIRQEGLRYFGGIQNTTHLAKKMQDVDRKWRSLTIGTTLIFDLPLGEYEKLAHGKSVGVLPAKYFRALLPQRQISWIGGAANYSKESRAFPLTEQFSPDILRGDRPPVDVDSQVLVTEQSAADTSAVPNAPYYEARPSGSGGARILSTDKSKLKLPDAEPDRWKFSTTSLEQVSMQLFGDKNELYKKIKDLATEAQTHGLKVKITEWGVGNARALIEIAERLKSDGITNVELFGFGNLAYKNWEKAPASITFIHDEAENLARFFEDNSIDFMFSNYGIFHLEEAEYKDHLRELYPKMKAGGEIVHTANESTAGQHFTDYQNTTNVSGFALERKVAPRKPGITLEKGNLQLDTFRLVKGVPDISAAVLDSFAGGRSASQPEAAFFSSGARRLELRGTGIFDAVKNAIGKGESFTVSMAQVIVNPSNEIAEDDHGGILNEVKNVRLKISINQGETDVAEALEDDNRVRGEPSRFSPSHTFADHGIEGSQKELYQEIARGELAGELKKSGVFQKTYPIDGAAGNYEQVIMGAFADDADPEQSGGFRVMHASGTQVPNIMAHLGRLWAKIHSRDENVTLEMKKEALAEYEWWFFQCNPYGRGGASLGDAMSMKAQIALGIEIREQYVHQDLVALSSTLESYREKRVNEFKTREATPKAGIRSESRVNQQPLGKERVKDFEASINELYTWLDVAGIESTKDNIKTVFDAIRAGIGLPQEIVQDSSAAEPLRGWMSDMSRNYPDIFQQLEVTEGPEFSTMVFTPGDDDVMLILGLSKAGKSSLAAQLEKIGYSLGAESEAKTPYVELHIGDKYLLVGSSQEPRTSRARGLDNKPIAVKKSLRAFGPVKAIVLLNRNLDSRSKTKVSPGNLSDLIVPAAYGASPMSPYEFLYQPLYKSLLASEGDVPVQVLKVNHGLGDNPEGYLAMARAVHQKIKDLQSAAFVRNETRTESKIEGVDFKNAKSLVDSGKISIHEMVRQIWEEVHESQFPRTRTFPATDEEGLSAEQIAKEMKEYIAAKKSEIEKDINNDNVTVARGGDGAIVGYIIHTSGEISKQGYVAWLVVRKGWQGLEIGTQLMNAARQWFEEMNMASVKIVPILGAGNFYNNYFGVEYFTRITLDENKRRVVRDAEGTVSMANWPLLVTKNEKAAEKFRKDNAERIPALSEKNSLNDDGSTTYRFFLPSTTVPGASMTSLATRQELREGDEAVRRSESRGVKKTEKSVETGASGVAGSEEAFIPVNAKALADSGELSTDEIVRRITKVFRSFDSESADALTPNDSDKTKKLINDGFITVMRQGKEIAGYVIHTVDANGSGHIRWLIVDGKFERRGIGMKLMNAAGQWFWDRNATSVLIEPINSSGGFYNQYFGVNYFTRTVSGKDNELMVFDAKHIVAIEEWPVFVAKNKADADQFRENHPSLISRDGTDKNEMIYRFFEPSLATQANLGRSEIRPPVATVVSASTISRELNRQYKVRSKIANDELVPMMSIGDQHGESEVLEQILEAAEKAEAGEFYIHGDAFDRGKNNKRNWEILIKLMAISKANPKIKVHYIFGNHDVMMFQAMILDDEEMRRLWLLPRNGGSQTLSQLGMEGARELAQFLFLNATFFVKDEMDYLHVHARIPTDTEGNPLITMQAMENMQKELERIQAEMKKALEQKRGLDQAIPQAVGAETQRLGTATQVIKKVAEVKKDEWMSPELLQSIKKLLLESHDLYWDDANASWISNLLETLPGGKVRIDKLKLDRLLKALGVSGVVFAHYHLDKLWIADDEYRLLCIDTQSGDPGRLIFDKGIQFKGVKREEADEVVSKSALLLALDDRISREEKKDLQKKAAPPEDGTVDRGAGAVDVLLTVLPLIWKPFHVYIQKLFSKPAVIKPPSELAINLSELTVKRPVGIPPTIRRDDRTIYRLTKEMIKPGPQFALPKDAFVRDVNWENAVEVNSEEDLRAYPGVAVWKRGIISNAFTKIQTVMFKDKEGHMETYVAKYAEDEDLEEQHIKPEAEILKYSAGQGAMGILKAKHFIKTYVNQRASVAMILFEDLRVTHPGMEFDKRARIAKGKKGFLTQKQLLNTSLQAARILEGLNSIGVFHFDYKSANIWIANDWVGDGRREDEDKIILFDFDNAFQTPEQFLARNLGDVFSPLFATGDRLSVLGQAKIEKEGLSFVEECEAYSAAILMLIMLVDPKNIFHSDVSIRKIEAHKKSILEMVDELRAKMAAMNTKDIPQKLKDALDFAVAADGVSGNSGFSSVRDLILAVENAIAGTSFEQHPRSELRGGLMSSARRLIFLLVAAGVFAASSAVEAASQIGKTRVPAKAIASGKGVLKTMEWQRFNPETAAIIREKIMRYGADDFPKGIEFRAEHQEVIKRIQRELYQNGFLKREQDVDGRWGLKTEEALGRAIASKKSPTAQVANVVMPVVARDQVSFAVKTSAMAGPVGFGNIVQRAVVKSPLKPGTQDSQDIIATYFYETNRAVDDAKKNLSNADFRKIFRVEKDQMTLEKVVQMAEFIFNIHLHESMRFTKTEPLRGPNGKTSTAISQAMFLLGTRTELFKDALFGKVTGKSGAPMPTDWNDFLVDGPDANYHRALMTILYFSRRLPSKTFSELFPKEISMRADRWGKDYYTLDTPSAKTAFRNLAEKFEDDLRVIGRRYVERFSKAGGTGAGTVIAPLLGTKAGGRSEMRGEEPQKQPWKAVAAGFLGIAVSSLGLSTPKVSSLSDEELNRVRDLESWIKENGYAVLGGSSTDAGHEQFRQELIQLTGMPFLALKRGVYSPTDDWGMSMEVVREFMEKVDAMVKDCVREGKPLRLLDMGAGTGYFALAAHYRAMQSGVKDVKIVATELQPEAFENIKFNIQLAEKWRNVDLLKSIIPVLVPGTERDTLGKLPKEENGEDIKFSGIFFNAPDAKNDQENGITRIAPEVFKGLISDITGKLAPKGMALVRASKDALSSGLLPKGWTPAQETEWGFVPPDQNNWRVWKSTDGIVRSGVWGVDYVAQFLAKFSPELGAAFFTRFARAGSRMRFKTRGPFETELKIQNLLIFNKAGREFAVGQKSGSYEYEIVEGFDKTDAVVPKFSSDFALIGHSHPPKEGQPTFLPSDLDLDNMAPSESSLFILSSYGITRYSVDEQLWLESQKEYLGFYKAMAGKSSEQVTDTQKEFLNSVGIQLGFTPRSPSGRSEARVPDNQVRAETRAIVPQKLEAFNKDPKKLMLSAADGTSFGFQWNWLTRNENERRVRVEVFKGLSNALIAQFDFTLDGDRASATYGHEREDARQARRNGEEFQENAEFAVWVDKDYRDRNLGSVLLYLGHQLAKSLGALTMSYYNVSHNQSFYRKNGARQTTDAGGKSRWTVNLAELPKSIPVIEAGKGRTEAREIVEPLEKKAPEASEKVVSAPRAETKNKAVSKPRQQEKGGSVIEVVENSPLFSEEKPGLAIERSSGQSLLASVKPEDVVEILRVNPEGLGAVRGELRGKAAVMQTQIEKKFDESVKKLDLVLKGKNADEIQSYINSTGFMDFMEEKFGKQLESLLGYDGGDSVKAVGQVVENIRAFFRAVPDIGVRVGTSGSVDSSVPLRRTRAQGKDSIEEVSDRINAAIDNLTQKTGEHAIGVLMNHSGAESADVLRMLERLTLERLIVLHAKGKLPGGAFNTYRKRTQVVFDENNPNRTALKQAQKAIGENDGRTVAIITDKKVEIEKVGLFMVIAEIAAIEDPQLRALAMDAIRYIFLKYASATKELRHEMMTNPDLIRADLNKMGFGSVIQMKGNTLVFDMQALADSFTARQSVDQAA